MTPGGFGNHPRTGFGTYTKRAGGTYTDAAPFRDRECRFAKDLSCRFLRVTCIALPSPLKGVRRKCEGTYTTRTYSRRIGNCLKNTCEEPTRRESQLETATANLHTRAALVARTLFECTKWALRVAIGLIHATATDAACLGAVPQRSRELNSGALVSALPSLRLNSHSRTVPSRPSRGLNSACVCVAARRFLLKYPPRTVWGDL